ncbi:MAG: hypothetical protein EA397_03510 [Deltaproteobacteria bacterium]|nr:MAG: hypothetical protein EA397_03510 [Deltaproteobacteria bacterium]
MKPRVAVLALLLGGCIEPPVVEVAGLTVDLITPADVDPLDGVEQLVLRVVDAEGHELARSIGSPSQGVSLPPITTFGLVEVEVTGRRDGVVLSAARTGLIALNPEDVWQIDTLFLPINQAIELQWSPASVRLGHAALPAPDGRVLLVGGRVAGSASISTSSEWWSIRRGYDGNGPGLPSGQAPAASQRLSDGSYLLAGGTGPTGPTDQVVILDPDLESLRTVEPLSAPTDQICAAHHPTLGALLFTQAGVQAYTVDGRSGQANDFDASRVRGCVGMGERILVAGMNPGGWGVLRLGQAEWPTPIQSRFSAIPGVSSVDGPMVIDLPDGRGWVGGGFGSEPNRSTYLIDLEGPEAEPSHALAEARVDGVVRRWRGGQLALAGGFSDEIRAQPVRTVEIFDPERGSRLSIPVPPRAPQVNVLPGGAILLTGGLITSSQAAGAYAIMPWPEGS